MKNVDFLPPELLRQNEFRALRWWWLGVCAAFAIVVGSAAGFQFHRKHNLRGELARLEPIVQEAKQNEQTLDALRSALQRETQFANLFAFIDHDWPRSQILAELWGPFPDVMRLSDLSLQTTEIQALSGPPATAVTQVLAEETATATQVDPAAADLDTLQTLAEKKRLVVILNGTTHDVTQLHQYVARLHASPLFESAKLEALDAVTDGAAGELVFSIRVQVRAPYGVPGGPQKPAGDSEILEAPAAQQVASTTSGTENAP